MAKNYTLKIIRCSGGFASMTVIILIFVISLFVVALMVLSSLNDVALARNALHAVRSFATSESGLEDIVFRIRNAKTHDASETLTLNSGFVETISAAIGNTTFVTSTGNITSHIRKISARLFKTSTEIAFYYGVQVGEGGLSMGNNAVVVGNVFSDGDIIGGPGTKAWGDVIVAGGIFDNPANLWTAHDADFFFATANGNRDVAQSFISASAGPINRVSVYLGKVGSPGGDITVRIVSDDGDEPSNSDIANTVITPGIVGASPAWVDVAFASPATAVSGTKYWIVLDYGSSSASDHWNWRRDSSDAYASNTGKYTSNWQSGGATWTNVGGDLAFRVWIGGTNNKIDGVTVGSATSGTAYANAFVNATVHGTACPNAYCVIDNQDTQALPISATTVQSWKDAAAAGGTCVEPECTASGDFVVGNGETKTLGPKKITGTLTVDNNARLIVAGTLWVVGSMQISNGCTVELAGSYGDLSGVIISNDVIAVSNNCTFKGSGNPASFVMLLSDKNSPGSDVITVDNNSLGVVFYANMGAIKFANNAAAKEATAYKIRLDNNATLIYDSGLANAQFSSGPGGGWQMLQWREVE